MQSSRLTAQAAAHHGARYPSRTLGGRFRGAVALDEKQQYGSRLVREKVRVATPE